MLDNNDKIPVAIVVDLVAEFKNGVVSNLVILTNYVL
jgi:hypothetical protein